MRHCGLASLRGFSADPREAWRRFAPILALLDLGAWSDDERRALVDVIRAKGGRSERDYIERYCAHPRLHAALAPVARAPSAERARRAAPAGRLSATRVRCTAPSLRVQIGADRRQFAGQCQRGTDLGQRVGVAGPAASPSCSRQARCPGNMPRALALPTLTAAG